MITKLTDTIRNLMKNKIGFVDCSTAAVQFHNNFMRQGAAVDNKQKTKHFERVLDLPLKANTSQKLVN